MQGSTLLYAMLGSHLPIGEGPEEQPEGSPQ